MLPTVSRVSRFSALRFVPCRARALPRVSTFCTDATISEANRDRALAYLRKHSPHARLPRAPRAAAAAVAQQPINKCIPSVSGQLPSPEALKSLLESRHGALQVQLLDVSDKASFADWLVVCCGHATAHIRAIADGLRNDMRASGVLVDGDMVSLCGRDSLDWIVVDIGPIVVHVMTAEARELYQLEQLWLPHNQSQSTASDQT